MDVIEAIRKRMSVRNFLDKPIGEDKLKLILEAGRLAPSAKNIQEWVFVAVKDKLTRQKLMQVAKNQAFVAEAPVVIACCATVTDYKMTCGQLAYPIDLAIAITHMSLEATELGIGSCWVGAFYEDPVKEVLGIPGDVRVVELLALGYAKAGGQGERQSRKALGEIVRWEHW
ncbi:MAG: nitroreductase family protein [Candidatus Omnitrophota bacterium]